MDDLIRDFLLESYENLDRLDQEFVKLETEPGNLELLKSIFRTIHTIKGTCGFLGFSKLEALTHAGENLLSVLRDGQLQLNTEITTALLAMVDAVRQLLASIDASGSEGERNDAELIATLARLLPTVTEAPESASGPPADTMPAQGEQHDADSNIGEILIKEKGVNPIDVKDAAEQQREGDPRHLGEILVEKGSVKPQDVLEALNLQQAHSGNNTSESTIRVDVNQLDRLMNRVGELVLLRNQILQFTNNTEDSGLLATSQRLNLITTELQEGVMKTRMQPIGNVWSKFPRTVRDVATACGKKVLIEMEGKETELDKTIIEAIKDPLTHIVRNSVDHGLETPSARVTAGKPAEGRLLLRAYHEGGQVNIEISDDGAGLDYEKIRNKALQRGVITPDQAARMTERELVSLLFLPGFSTADKITNVSGRGVGLDVVRTNIEKIGGTVDLQSKIGQGSTVRMKIPLTLAIIPALIVTSGGDRYAIPQISLLELVRLEGEHALKGIERVNSAPVYRLRGCLLPLVYLNRELHPHRQVNDPNGSVNIVVLRADDQQFGLIVDEINDTEEIVVKPLSKQLKSVNTYAGATIMGDGKVALILDVLGLAQRARVINEVRDRAVTDKDSRQTSGPAESQQRNAVLLFQSGDHGRMAIDLSLVARLEEFPREVVEYAGDQEVVQYRGQIMPLVRVSEALRIARAAAHSAPNSLQVVVYANAGRSVGLVVDRILDIVEESFVIQRHADRKGVLGSAVIQKKVTDILDVPGLLAAAEGNLSLAELPA